MSRSIYGIRYEYNKLHKTFYIICKLHSIIDYIFSYYLAHVLNAFCHLVASDGRITYSEVKGFLHKLPTVTNFYKSITTSRNETINLSGRHLIYSRKSVTEKFHPM